MSNATEFGVSDSVETYINGTSSPLETHGESKPWERPLSQRDLILQHLRSGKTLTQQEAEDLYDCAAVAAAVHLLKKEGWNIVTERFKNERNRSIARYRLEEPAQPLSEEPLAEEPDDEPAVLPEQDQPEPQPAPQPSPEPVEQNASESVQSLAVRMDPDGPPLQIGEASYRLTKPQMRYLSVNMALFAEMEECGN